MNNEARQCTVKQATVLTGKLVWNIYEVAGFTKDSQKTEWRPYRDSNPGSHRERVVS